MKLLRLTPALKATSSSYNQFSLGFKEVINQTIGSLHKHELSIDKKIKVFHGDGSILKMSMKIRSLLAKNNYDVIHIHNGLTGITFLIAIFPFRLNLLKRTIFTLHNSWNVLKIKNQILNFFVMLVVEKIITCGISSQNSIPKIINYILRKKTKAIVNGFDHQRIDNIESIRISKSHFHKNSKIKIVYIGGFNNIKNQMALLEALKMNKIEAELIFLGDGVRRESSIIYSKQINGPIKIKFKGLVSRDLAIEHMLDADVFISLSKGEGMPIAVLEAMYSGCFMILSKIPPHTEISPPQERCLFVDQENNDEIVSSLNYISKNIKTVKHGREISKEHSIDNFSVKNMLASYKEQYNHLCQISTDYN